jgi:hypothetical protein
MKKIILGVLLLVFQACNLNDFKFDGDEDDSSRVEALLQRSSYYISDRCYKGNEYAKYEFFDDNTYRKIIFNEPTLETIKEVIEDNVQYLDMFNIILYQGDLKFECVVDEKDENSIRLVCANKRVSEYSIIKTLWTSKALALYHRDYDCDGL